MNESKPRLFSPGVGKKGMNELHFAAYGGDIVEMTRCLAAGVDPNAVDDYRGYTPLLWLADMASIGGPRVDMLDLLVRAGADVNVRAATGDSALSLASNAMNGNGAGLVARLLEYGATDERIATVEPHPHPSLPSSWPFPEPVNRLVFTTTRVVHDGYPVLLVSRTDGDWQFLCTTTTEASDCMIACLGCAFQRDPSLGEVANLSPGWKAWRASINDPWERWFPLFDKHEVEV